MALSKTITTRHGFIAEDAYLRVESVRLASKNLLDFSVSYYKTRESIEPFDTTAFVCTYELDGDNPIKQAYAHLKTLSEFNGTTDC